MSIRVSVVGCTRRVRTFEDSRGKLNGHVRTLKSQIKGMVKFKSQDMFVCHDSMPSDTMEEGGNEDDMNSIKNVCTTMSKVTLEYPRRL